MQNIVFTLISGIMKFLNCPKISLYEKEKINNFYPFR